MEGIQKWAPPTPPDPPTERELLVGRAKMFGRTRNAAWIEWVGKYGKGTLNPALHTDAFLQEFFAHMDRTTWHAENAREDNNTWHEQQPTYKTTWYEHHDMAKPLTTAELRARASELQQHQEATVATASIMPQVIGTTRAHTHIIAPCNGDH